MKKLIVLIILLGQPQAFAWGALGHETVAEIAERRVANDEHTVGAIRSILGVEPLAIAATWPDKVRSDKRFNNFSPVHFVTMPDKEMTSDTALVALDKFSRLVVSKEASLQEKMIALRYIIHIIGDLYQPLHVGNDLDSGGNLCLVKLHTNPKNKAYTKNLHSIWDSVMLKEFARQAKYESEANGWFGYKEFATYLMKTPTFNKAQENMKMGEPTLWWITESKWIRITDVYPDNKKPEDRKYCKKSYSDDVADEDIPIVGKDYIQAKRPIVENQIIKAGIRTALYLNNLFKNYQYQVK